MPPLIRFDCPEAISPAGEWPRPQLGNAEATDEAPECVLFRTVNDLDDKSQAIVNEDLAPALSDSDPEAADAAFREFLDAYQPFVREELPKLLESYEQLAEVVPDDLRADVETLSTFTAEIARGLDATLRLDKHSRETCDLVIAD